MRTLGAAIVGLNCLVAIAGCTTNKSIANITTPRAKLEMSVGTINDSAGTLTGTAGTYLNVVTSFRNVLGNSAYENPGWFSLTGPGGTIIASTPGNPCDQLFSYGLFPDLSPPCVFDSVGAGLVGLPPTYNPPSAIGGYSLGFIPTGAAAAGGAYSVTTVVPVNGGNVNYTASATLPASPVVLANATGVTSFTSDGKGGGTFAIGNPLRPRSKVHAHGNANLATEYLIVIETAGSSGSFLVAAVETTSTTATITGTGDCSTSAGGSPIPCGSNTAYVIDADYPLVEAGPPQNVQTSPTLTGAQGTSDISVSGMTAINE